jgi:hypothetical protein
MFRGPAPTPHHDIGALGADPVLPEAISEADGIVRIGRDEAAEPCDPIDLCLGGIGEVHDDAAMIIARGGDHAPLDHVEQHLEPEISGDVGADLPPGVPVGAVVPVENLWLDDPFAVVARIWIPVVVDVRLEHLHALGDDRPVGEEFDVAVEQADLALGSASDQCFRVGDDLGGVQPGGQLAASVDQEGGGERRVVGTKDLLVEVDSAPPP